MEKDIKSALDEIDEINPFASYLDSSSLSLVKGWIDTGSYVLNALISGSGHKMSPQQANQWMAQQRNERMRSYMKHDERWKGYY